MSAPLVLGLVGPVPPPNGGMAMQTRQLAELLRAEGLQVELLPTNAPYKPAWVERLPVVRALFRLLPYLLGAWRLAGRVDVVHVMANSGWSWQLFAAPPIWAAWLRGTPVVVNYRGGEAADYFKQSFSRVRPTLRRASSIVVPSGFLQGVFQEYRVDARVIPNIVNLQRFHPASTPLEQSGFSLVIARNLEPIYGIETAIRAVAILRQQVPAVRLEIAGSGPLRESLQALVAELGLSDCVSFLGRLDPDEMAVAYRRAHVMVNPTLVDNMPNSVLEALACGVAVVSTDVGGVPFVVSHEQTALLVPAEDPQAMADALLRLSRDGELRTGLIERGLQEAGRYDWPQVREHWLQHYRSLLGGVA